MSSSSPLSSTVDENNCVTLISIKIKDLAVTQEACKKIGKSQSMMQQFMRIGLGTTVQSAPKHEKKIVRLYQSASYSTDRDAITIGGSSVIYSLIYTSEIFGDGVWMDGNIVNPSLVAHIGCPPNSDCQLQLQLCYSSSITSGREIILGEAFFTKLEMLMSISEKGLFSTKMNSEFCSGGGTAEIMLWDPLYSSFQYLEEEKRIKIISPLQKIESSHKNTFNPLYQRYVIYKESPSAEKMVDLEEYTVEPKFSAKVPFLFMDRFQSTLHRCIKFWNLRIDMEKIRQGRFQSINEAFSYGWHQLTVTVLAARVKTSKAYMQRLQLQLIQQQQLQQVQQVNNVNNSGPMYHIFVPVDGEKDPTTSAIASNHYLTNGRKYLVDESSPSSFVSIYLKNHDSNMLTHVGRTSTEYFTSRPVYGTNIHSSFVKKPSKECVAADDTVKTSLRNMSNAFLLFETVDRDLLGAETASRVTLPCEECSFSKYIPSITDTSLRLEFYLESKSQQVRKYGIVDDLSLSNSETWQKVTVLEGGVPEYEDIEVLVKMELRSPELSSPPPVVPVWTTSFDKSFNYERNCDGTVLNMPESRTTTRASPETDSDSKSSKDARSSARYDHRDISSIISNCYEWMWLLGYRGTDPLNLEDMDTGLFQRVDYAYPLDWMKQHVENLKNLLIEVKSCLPTLCILVESDQVFRPSILKKNLEVQALPVNLHYQLFTVRRLGSDKKPVLEVNHCVTCGAISPHYLGYKNGGLFYLETELRTQREQLKAAKNNFRGVLEKEVVSNKWVCMDGNSPTAQYLEVVGSQVLNFEAGCLSVAHRRIYAVSQVVSIAVNSFLLKLYCVVNQFLPPSDFDRWISFGFLLIFEGLLSVIKKERIMLEDTVSAVEALKFYQFRVKSRPPDDSEDVQVDIVGRELVITLPAADFSKLSDKTSDVVIKIYPVLFTQVCNT